MSNASGLDVYGKPVGRALAVYLVIAFGTAYPIEVIAAEIMANPFSTKFIVAELMLGGVMYAPAAASFIALLLNGFRLRECMRFLGITKPRLKWIAYSIIITYSVLGVCVGILTLIYGSVTYVSSAMALALLPTPPGSRFPLAGFKGLMLFLLITVASGLTVNTLFALGEEIGWRGFLYSMLYRRLGYVASSFAIGFIWGLWHAPLIVLINYDFTLPTQYSPAPLTHVLLFCLFTTALNSILLRVRELSGSVLPPAFIHGLFNAVAGLGLLASMWLPEYLRFPGGLVGTLSASVVAVVMNVIILVRRRGSGPMT